MKIKPDSFDKIWKMVWGKTEPMPINEILCNKCQERLAQHLANDQTQRKYGKALLHPEINGSA